MKYLEAVKKLNEMLKLKMNDLNHKYIRPKKGSAEHAMAMKIMKGEPVKISSKRGRKKKVVKVFEDELIEK